MNHCVCRVFGILLVFVIYAALSVEGADVAYDVDCSASGSVCNELNNECNSGTSKCACTSSSFRNSADTACETKIALEGTCTADPAVQCVDTNAECHATNLVCTCKTNFFANKDNGCSAQLTALNDACDATDPSTDQCTVTDSECRVDGTAKCLCKATHYTAGSACTIRKNPDETDCVLGGCVTHATCDTSASPTVCECDAGYTASPTTSPTMCSGVVKFASLSYMYVVPILVSMMSLLR